MLDIAPNPYSDPIKNFYCDLKKIEWRIPFIVQIVHSIITVFILAVLLVLYVSVGLVSQVSTTFWDLIVGMGERMSFSHPIESTAYAVATVIYFILFLPFFILQSPIWLGGWFASKIGFKPFITILCAAVVVVLLYLYNPNIGSDAYSKINAIKTSIYTEFFVSDSIQIDFEAEPISHESNTKNKN